MKRALVVLFILLFPFGAFAQEAVSVDLAQDHVDITTGFNGGQLILFGVKDKPGDLAVVIRGPLRDIVVRRKERVAGMWMNGAAMDFENVPVYYDYALSRGEKAMRADHDLSAEGIGLDALYFQPEDEKNREKIHNFQEALIRIKQSQGLYPLAAKPVKFIKSNFFRVSFYLPSNVPIGTYEVESFLIQNGEVAERHVTQVRVGQVGTGAKVYGFAHEHGLSYGLLCVAIALLAGWTATLLRRE